MAQAESSGNPEIVRSFDEKCVYEGIPPAPVFGVVNAWTGWDMDMIQLIHFRSHTVIICALGGHQNEVFHWSIETKCKDSQSGLVLLVKSLEVLFQSNNFDGFKTAIDMGVDLSTSWRANDHLTHF
jgi:hypothetical protein